MQAERPGPRGKSPCMRKSTGIGANNIVFLFIERASLIRKYEGCRSRDAFRESRRRRPDPDSDILASRPSPAGFHERFFRGPAPFSGSSQTTRKSVSGKIAPARSSSSNASFDPAHRRRRTSSGPRRGRRSSGRSRGLASSEAAPDRHPRRCSLFSFAADRARRRPRRRREGLFQILKAAESGRNWPFSAKSAKSANDPLRLAGIPPGSRPVLVGLLSVAPI